MKRSLNANVLEKNMRSLDIVCYFISFINSLSNNTITLDVSRTSYLYLSASKEWHKVLQMGLNCQFNIIQDDTGESPIFDNEAAQNAAWWPCRVGILVPIPTGTVSS